MNLVQVERPPYYRWIPSVLLVLPACLSGLLYLNTHQDLVTEQAELDALTQQMTYAYQDVQVGFTHIIMDMNDDGVWDRNVGGSLVSQGLRAYQVLFERYRLEYPELEGMSGHLAYIDQTLPVISQSHQALHENSYRIFLAVMAINKATRQLARDIQSNTQQLNSDHLRYATISLVLLAVSLAAGLSIQLHFLRQKVVVDRRLGESTRLLAHYAEGSQDVFWILNPDTQRLEYVSQAYATVFASEEDPVGQLWWLSAVDPRDRDYMSSCIEAAISESREYEAEYRIIDADGQCRWVREKARPVKGVDETRCHIVGVLTDITLQKEHQQSVVQAHKMEAVGQLSGGLAHDFNNILSVVKTNLFLIQESPSIDQSLSPLLDCALQGCDRGQQMTRALLDFARGGEGELDNYNVNKLIDQFSPLLKSAMTSTVRTLFQLEEGLLEVKVDRGLFENALLNLCINARDAMPDGGLLTIRTYRSTMAGSDDSPVDAVCIEVSDTGQGIPEDIRNRIFEPFFTTKDNKHGSGMGLAMVYAFVREHQGRIIVLSNLGPGTTFRIWLPLAHLLTLNDTASLNQGAGIEPGYGAEGV